MRKSMKKYLAAVVAMSALLQLSELYDTTPDALLGCVREEPVSEALFGPALGQRAGEFLEKLIPVYDYFNIVTMG